MSLMYLSFTVNDIPKGSERRKIHKWLAPLDQTQFLSDNSDILETSDIVDPSDVQEPSNFQNTRSSEWLVKYHNTISAWRETRSSLAWIHGDGMLDTQNGTSSMLIHIRTKMDVVRQLSAPLSSIQPKSFVDFPERKDRETPWHISTAALLTPMKKVLLAAHTILTNFYELLSPSYVRQTMSFPLSVRYMKNVLKNIPKDVHLTVSLKIFYSLFLRSSARLYKQFQAKIFLKSRYQPKI